MKGIIIDSRQIRWFREMLNGSYQGDIGDDAKSRILGALEYAISQPQEDWVPALNIIPKGDSEAGEDWKPIFSEEIDHKKGDE